MTVTIHEGDCREVLRTIPDASVDAVATDPPYGIKFMGSEWDGPEGVAFKADFWREVLRVLKPGGHLLAFGGTRMHHRLTCAIEDAGFEIRDMIAWLYGSGFPKSHNGPWGGTALKPALEPIAFARKPLIGTVAQNVQAHGTGGLNIDGCRVGTDVVTTHSRGSNGAFPKRPGETSAEESGRKQDQREGIDHSPRVGRWPANVIHDGSLEVEMAFAAFGDRSSPWIGNAKGVGAKGGTVFGGGAQKVVAKPEYADKGTASRFFYCAKASKADRGEGNNHPTVKPADLMRYLCRLVTPPGGVVLDPFMGSGSTGKAAILEGFSFIGIEREAPFLLIARARIHEAQRAAEEARRNAAPDLFAAE